MTTDDAKDPKVSKHNSSINILMRLDELWKSASKNIRLHRYRNWNDDLECIFLELVGDIENDEYEDAKNKVGDKNKGYHSQFIAFDKQLSGLGEIIDKEPEGWKDPTKEQIKKRSDQYKILFDKHLFLKRLEKKLGKGSAWDDGDEDDWE